MTRRRRYRFGEPELRPPRPKELDVNHEARYLERYEDRFREDAATASLCRCEHPLPTRDDDGDPVCFRCGRGLAR
jgi:hypothetical protein